MHSFPLTMQNLHRMTNFLIKKNGLLDVAIQQKFSPKCGKVILIDGYCIKNVTN